MARMIPTLLLSSLLLLCSPWLLLGFAQASSSSSASPGSTISAVVDTNGYLSTEQDGNDDSAPVQSTNQTSRRRLTQQQQQEPTKATVSTTFGVAQTLDTSVWSDDAIRNKLQETRRYVQTVVDPDARKRCTNQESFCTVWSLQGECQHNAIFMDRKCPAACQRCATTNNNPEESDRPPMLPKATTSTSTTKETTTTSRPRGVRQDVGEELDESFQYSIVDMDHPGSDFGEVQLLESTEEPTVTKEAVLAKLRETTVYMNNVPRNVQQDCSNADEMCTIWSLVNECDLDAEYMTYNCAPACQTCHLLQDSDDEDDEEEHPVGPGSRFGVVQQIDPSNEPLLARELEKSEHYFDNVVMQQTKYEPVRNICRNLNEDCTLWAHLGECDANPGYMLKNCAVSCQACEHLHYDTRCTKDPDAVDVWKPGDVNKMFSRIVKDHPNATVLSRPSLLPGDNEETAEYEIGPWVITIDDFITPKEAERLIHFGSNEGYERSIGVGDIDEETGEAEEEITEARTSGNAWCEDDCEEDPAVARVLQRMENLTGIPTVNSEALQLLKYEIGQFYLTHHDYVDYEQNSHQGPRILTVFCYLNDVEEGGETRFDWFEGEDGDGLFVTPKLGRVVLWPSVLDENPSEIDERTEHEAMPIVKGQKYAANAWFHLRSREKGILLGC